MGQQGPWPVSSHLKSNQNNEEKDKLNFPLVDKERN